MPDTVKHMPIELLIARIIERIKLDPDNKYYWFRFTWSQITKPIWIVWIEGLQGTIFQCTDPSLEKALITTLDYLLR